MSKTTDLWGFQPRTTIQVHLRHEKNMVIDLSNITKSEGGQEYRVLSIGTVDFFMTEKQAEQLFEELETKLNKYLHLKNENKYLRGLSR